MDGKATARCIIEELQRTNPIPWYWRRAGEEFLIYNCLDELFVRVDSESSANFFIRLGRGETIDLPEEVWLLAAQQLLVNILTTTDIPWILAVAGERYILRNTDGVCILRSNDKQIVVDAIEYATDYCAQAILEDAELYAVLASDSDQP